MIQTKSKSYNITNLWTNKTYCSQLIWFQFPRSRMKFKQTSIKLKTHSRQSTRDNGIITYNTTCILRLIGALVRRQQILVKTKMLGSCDAQTVTVKDLNAARSTSVRQQNYSELLSTTFIGRASFIKGLTFLTSASQTSRSVVTNMNCTLVLVR